MCCLAAALLGGAGLVRLLAGGLLGALAAQPVLVRGHGAPWCARPDDARAATVAAARAAHKLEPASERGDAGRVGVRGGAPEPLDVRPEPGQVAVGEMALVG